MKVKTTIVITGRQPHTIHIAAVPGTNATTNKTGFLAYGFKANTPEPTDTSSGFKLIDHLFNTEAEALKEGLKIAKAQLKHDYSMYKKMK
jgi:hypothetical protein